MIKKKKDEETAFQKLLKYLNQEVSLYELTNKEKGISYELAIKELETAKDIVKNSDEEIERLQKIEELHKKIDALIKQAESDRQGPRGTPQSKAYGAKEGFIEDREKIDEEIHQKNIALIEDEFIKRRKEIEDAYQLEMKRIEGIENATKEQRKILSDLAGKEKDKKLQLVKQDEIMAPFNNVKSIANLIQNIFQFGSQTVFANFLRALQVTEQIIQLFKSINAVGGVVSLLGKIFGFFIPGGEGAAAALAGGGELPGFGGGDKVPAMLEAGEGVINKYGMLRAKSMFGENFLSLLNGYGAMTSRMNHLSLGGVVRRNNGMKVDMPDIKIKGSDIFLSWQRQKLIESRRGNPNV